MWHTGPKTGDCFVYDGLIRRTWVKIGRLHTPRAYGSAASLPDGSMMVIGGVGCTEGALDTTETVSR